MAFDKSSDREGVDRPQSKASDSIAKAAPILVGIPYKNLTTEQKAECYRWRRSNSLCTSCGFTDHHAINCLIKQAPKIESKKNYKGTASRAPTPVTLAAYNPLAKTPSRPCYLLDLPEELRDLSYVFRFPPNGKVVYKQFDELALRNVNMQIRQETLEIYLKRNLFQVAASEMPTRHHRFEALPKDPILYFSKMLKAFNAFTYVYFLDLSKFAHKSITKEQITGQTELIRRCSNLAILNLNFHPSHFYHRDIRSSQSPYEGPTSQQPNQLSYITCRFRLDGIFALSKLKLLSVQQDYDEEVVRKVDPEVEGGKHHVMNMLEMWFKAGFKEQGRNVVCLWECRNNAS